jgi:hypothetical protein
VTRGPQRAPVRADLIHDQRVRGDVASFDLALQKGHCVGLLDFSPESYR